MVTLLGTIVRQLDGRMLFRVLPGCGDAALCGFRRESEIWLKRAQCEHIVEAQRSGEPDQIYLPAALATQKAELANAQRAC